MKPTGITWYQALLLAFALCVTLFPVFWLVSTSLKPFNEWVVVPPAWIPNEPTFANYRALFAQSLSRNLAIHDTALGPIINSIIVSSVATAASVMLGCAAAIAISRYHLRSAIPMSILTVRMIPPVLLAMPIAIYFGLLGMRDTLIGLILVYTMVTVPFSMLMLKSFVDSISPQIEEAAMLDGMSRWAAHFKITLPLMKGGIASTTIFIFILNWSEFLIAVSLTDKSATTIPVELQKHAGDYGTQSALAVAAIIPLLIGGFAIQRYLVRGLPFGMLKE